MKLLIEDRYNPTPEESINMRAIGKIMGYVNDIKDLHSELVNNNFSQEAAGHCADQIIDAAKAIIDTVNNQLQY